MTKKSTFAAAVAALLLAAGGATAAALLLNRRDVTTSSPEAYRLYRLGRENELKLYNREALASYAEALSHDGRFVMATLRLAMLIYPRDPARAKDLIRSAERYRDGLTRREQRILDLHVADFGGDSAKYCALVDQYLEEFPDDTEGYMRKARQLVGEGKMPEAIAVYERILSIDPNDAFAYNTLGYYFLQQGDFAKAEDYLRRYRFLAPDQANPYDSLGELFTTTGRYDEAEESFKKALEIKPDFHHSIGMLGTVALGRGEYEKAATRFEQAALVAEKPGEKGELFIAAAYSLAFAGRREDALSKLMTIESSIPSLAESERPFVTARLHQVRGITLSILGDGEAALAEVDEAARLVEQLPAQKKEGWAKNLVRIRSLVLARQGRAAEAVEGLSRDMPGDLKADGFGYFPGVWMSRIALAESYVALGRNEEAARVLMPIFEKNARFEPAVAVARKLGLKVEAPSPALPAIPLEKEAAKKL